MRTNGVEIAKRNCTELAVSHANVAQDLLDHNLSVTIGVRCRSGHILGVRSLVIHSVNCRRGRENNFLTAVLAHDPKQDQSTVNVVCVIFKRFLDGFTDSLKACKVNHRVYFVLVKNFR